MSDQTTKPTILYIEDDQSSAALIERILVSFGYDLMIAYTGLDGIRAAIDNTPDLVLVDLDLPDLTGFEVAMRLRELGDFRKTPIIAISSQDTDEYRGMARVAEISSYLTKPINVQQLYDKIEQYLGDNDDLLIDIELDQDKNYFDRETVQHLLYKIRELEFANEELRVNNRDLVEQLVSSLRDAESTNEELRRLDQIKDDFIQRVAHEVRTPLTVLMGYFSVIEISPEIKALRQGQQDIDLYLSSLGEGFNRMRKVIDEIIMISRLAAGKVEITMVPVLLNDLLTSAVRPFEEAIEQRDIALEYTARMDHSISLVGDLDLLRLAFINLIGNAIKYTPDGGHVYISAQRDKNILRIAIQDTGIGIDPNDQHRIFDRFYSADSVMLHSTSKTAFRGGGLGLGLAICKAVIEAHRGHIYVESAGLNTEELPGSIFYVELPIEAQEELDKASIYESFN